MKETTVNTLVRAFFMLIAAFFVGKHFGGTAITNDFVDMAIGVAIAIVTTAYGIVGKTATADQIMATAKQLLVFAGGILVSSGKVTIQNVDTWIGVVTTLLGIFLSNWYKSVTAPPLANN